MILWMFILKLITFDILHSFAGSKILTIFITRGESNQQSLKMRPPLDCAARVTEFAKGTFWLGSHLSTDLARVLDFSKQSILYSSKVLPHLDGFVVLVVVVFVVSVVAADDRRSRRRGRSGLQVLIFGKREEVRLWLSLYALDELKVSLTAFWCSPNKIT